MAVRSTVILERKNPAMRKNPARAERTRMVMERLEPFDADGNYIERESENVTRWVKTPPHLTEGHHELAGVRNARSVARRARKAAEGDKLHGVRFLGQGNFGVAFAVDDEDSGVRVVKMPALTNVHGKPWTRSEQIENLMHEAGVANELRELGFSVVPEIEYVEFEDGLPALVREFGEPVDSMSPEEFDAIEHELVAVEDAGWLVQDTIQLYRRKDGSPFVGDVGIWQVQTKEKKDKRYSLFDTSLPSLLRELASSVLGVRGSKFATLPDALFTASHLETITSRTESRKDKVQGLGFLSHILEKSVETVEQRQAHGLSVPESLLIAVAHATSLIQSMMG